MRKIIISLIAFVISFNTLPAKHRDKKIVKGIIERYLSENNNFSTTKDVWGNYTLDLTVEAIINYTLNSNDKEYIPIINRFFTFRNYTAQTPVSFSKSPFCDVYYSYFQLNQDSGFVKNYVQESYAIKQNTPRFSNGAVCIMHNGMPYMLIDFLQNYVTRMARAGNLSGDTAFYAEACNQLKIYTRILQYPDSKLYSQGLGWLEDKNQLSPSAWLRGQGWMMRGFVNTLNEMPENSVYFLEIKKIFQGFAEGLIKLQSKSGMWHNLPLLSEKESYPEVSGSAMIAYYILQAYEKGYLSENKFKLAALRTKKEIRKYIQSDFSIRNISPGPGTLYSINEYKTNAEIDNPHGMQAVLLLLSQK